MEAPKAEQKKNQKVFRNKSADECTVSLTLFVLFDSDYETLCSFFSQLSRRQKREFTEGEKKKEKKKKVPCFVIFMDQIYM